MYDKIINFIREWYRTDQFIPLHEPHFKEIDRKYVLDAIDSTFVSSAGEYVNKFEREIAKYLGAKRAVVTVNGTAALQVALRLAGVKAGDEVITQPLTFVATANAIAYNNATPLFIDVNEKTLGLCPDALEQFLNQNAEKRGTSTFNKITGKRISVMVPMHTFGHPCKMGRLIDLACAQLEQLDDILSDKRELANAYDAFFSNEEWCDFVKEPDGCTSNYWLNAVITSDKKQRDDLLKATNDSGVMTRPIWQLMSNLEMYKYCQKGDLQNAQWLQDRIVNLPSSVRI